MKLENIKSHENRWQTIKKKSSELSTLCGVDVCVLRFSADGRVADTWPKNPHQVKHILRHYKQQYPSKFKNSDGCATYTFSRRPFLSSTPEDIVSFPNELSPNSLKILYNKIVSKIEKISSKIEVLNDQSLRQSMFLAGRLTCNLNGSNSNSDNAWTSFSVDDPYLMTSREANVVPTTFPASATTDIQINNEFSYLYSDNIGKSIFSLDDPYHMPLLETSVIPATVPSWAENIQFNNKFSDLYSNNMGESIFSLDDPYPMPSLESSVVPATFPGWAADIQFNNDISYLYSDNMNESIDQYLPTTMLEPTISNNYEAIVVPVECESHQLNNDFSNNNDEKSLLDPYTTIFHPFPPNSMEEYNRMTLIPNEDVPLMLHGETSDRFSSLIGCARAQEVSSFDELLSSFEFS